MIDASGGCYALDIDLFLHRDIDGFAACWMSRLKCLEYVSFSYRVSHPRSRLRVVGNGGGGALVADHAQGRSRGLWNGGGGVGGEMIGGGMENESARVMGWQYAVSKKLTVDMDA